MKYLKIIIIALFLVACSNKPTDAIKFKKEYEKYNDTKIELTISENNIIEYKTNEEINKIIKETGVIYIGSPKDNKSRQALKLLLEAADSTDIQKIYYIDSLKGIDLSIDNAKTPIILFILNGEIVEYNINEKETMSEDEEIDLFNTYLKGIHEVLQDTCDEEC